MKELKLVEQLLKECGVDLECECQCEVESEESEEQEGYEDEGSEEGSETEFMDMDHPEDDELTDSDAPKYFESYKRLFEAENPCLPPASYSQAAASKLGPAAGCVTRDGKKGKFAPGFRPDPKKGFVKVDPHAMKTGGTASPHDDISDVQHWSGQPKR